MNRFLVTLLVTLTISMGVVGYFAHRDLFANSYQIDDCTPYKLETKNIDKDSFEVSWRTAEKCIGYLKYGTTPQETEIVVFGKEAYEKVKDHTVVVERLSAGTTYYYVVISNGEKFALNESVMKIDTKGY